jgi:hypothetical protein
MILFIEIPFTSTEVFASEVYTTLPIHHSSYFLMVSETEPSHGFQTRNSGQNAMDKLTAEIFETGKRGSCATKWMEQDLMDERYCRNAIADDSGSDPLVQEKAALWN